MLQWEEGKTSQEKERQSGSSLEEPPAASNVRLVNCLRNLSEGFGFRCVKP